MEDKKNRPDNSQFRQQRLPAWQPVMSPPHVSACLTFLAVVFIPIGVSIIVANDSIFEQEFRYDDVRKCTPSNNDGALVVNIDGQTFKQGCKIYLNFSIKSNVPGPVYMYYKLTNFYQNHRRFAKSRDTQQIAGKDVDPPSDDCDPILTPGSLFGNTAVALTVNTEAKTYANMKYSPCGLVAWSMFNDTFILYQYTSSGSMTMLCDTSQFGKDTNEPWDTSMVCKKKGVTWESDHDKFVKPALSTTTWTGNRTAYAAANITTDNSYLANGYYAFEAGHEVPITTDEDFMVWMRTASLPTFRKLYRIFPNGLTAGDYQMAVYEFFDSQQYGGTKSFVLSTVSWVGAKNAFLGYAYIVVGSVCLLCAIIFFIVHKVTGDRTQAAIDVLSELR